MVRTLWQCEKCWQSSPKTKCISCYPSPAFPVAIAYLPPKDYDEYKKWDYWYTWRYMMEWREDPESIYEIGSEKFDKMIEDAKARRLMPKAIPKQKSKFRRIYQLKLIGVLHIIDTSKP